MNILREWKKIFEGDLDSIIYELKDFLNTPAAVVLSGDLGAGKTTFTKAFLKSLGEKGETSSPSYSLVNEVGDIVHSDFYRLNDGSEVVHLELPMYLDEKDYFFVEWGKPYLRELYQEVPREFSFYELLFDMNEIKDGQKIPSRNIRLVKLPSH
ncbi:MAG: tRNA (adenosine(37)-N6)-threonylcarbamoyltransferase complex ATPase subunit type 1 TsaE [Halobacteriovoraceae bacterium]|nr:tRNA (adenosine(37)-N6)-threonylcarbamoyltransferase complex ATPase subunit type 1 TsaE [Halobacteriovoraceae bacterium]